MVESLEIRKRACGCFVCNRLVTEWSTSQVSSALEEENTTIAITCENRHDRLHSLMLPAKNSISLQQISFLTMMSPELHHLSLTNTTNPLLSSYCSLKSAR